MIYIYTLKDPITYEIKYIGKTKSSLDKRLRGHIDECLLKKNPRKSYKINWIKGLLKQNLKPIIEELDSTELDNWEWLEQYWISQFKNWGFKLTNMTDGGDGNKNQIFSVESNEKRRIALLGITFSQERRTNISKGSIGKVLSDMTKEKLKQLNLGKRYSMEVKLKKSKTVLQLDLDDNIINEFYSICEASRIIGCSKGAIQNCCVGRGKTSGGFKWIYKQ